MNNLTFALALSAFLLTGCHIKTDKLYVFKLDQPPIEDDWKNGLIYYLPVEKGRLNQLPPRTMKLDKETIHSSNTTCHHTDRIKNVLAALSAFYTEDELFIRVYWPDPTMDNRPAIWDPIKKSWDKTKGAEDGLGILWNSTGDPSHNCSSMCHLSDWLVTNSRLTPIHNMKTKNKEKYDLWAWWAGRNEPDGTVWTMLLDSSGINNNTLLTTSNDRNHLFHSKSSYKNGFWTVTITSPLISPAQLENDHYFQISIFDNTYSDHSISNDPQVLVFVRNKGVKQ